MTVRYSKEETFTLDCGVQIRAQRAKARTIARARSMLQAAELKNRKLLAEERRALGPEAYAEVYGDTVSHPEAEEAYVEFMEAILRACVVGVEGIEGVSAEDDLVEVLVACVPVGELMEFGVRLHEWHVPTAKQEKSSGQ